MKKIAALVASSALLLAAPGLAAPSKPRPPADPNRQICREETDIGTRLGTRRICHTAAEEMEARLNKRDFVDRLERGTSVCRGDLPLVRC